MSHDPSFDRCARCDHFRRCHLQSYDAGRGLGSCSKWVGETETEKGHTCPCTSFATIPQDLEAKICALNPRHEKTCGWPCHDCTCGLGALLRRFVLQLTEKDPAVANGEIASHLAQDCRWPITNCTCDE